MTPRCRYSWTRGEYSCVVDWPQQANEIEKKVVAVCYYRGRSATEVKDDLLFEIFSVPSVVKTAMESPNFSPVPVKPRQCHETLIVLVLLACWQTGCDDMTTRHAGIDANIETTHRGPSADKNIVLNRANEMMSPQSGATSVNQAVPADPSAVTVGPADRGVQVSFQSGLAHLTQKRYTDAASAFRMVVLDDPGNANAWYYLGLSYLEQGNVAAAAFPLDQAIQRQRGMGEAWLLRGIIKVKRSEFQDAGDDLDEALRLGQDGYNIYLHKAIVDLKQHDFSSTIDHADQAIQRDAAQPYPWFLRCLAHAGLKRQAESRADFQRMMALGADASMQAQARAALTAE